MIGNVISLLITLALQRSLRLIITTARKLITSPSYIQLAKTFSDALTQKIPTLFQTMHIVFQRKSALSVFAILVDGALIYSHPNQKHGGLPLTSATNNIPFRLTH